MKPLRATEDNLLKFIKDVEQCLLKSDIAKAQEFFARIQPSKIPRTKAPKIAELARRAQLPIVGIRILHPILRPKYGSSTASIEEKACYASCLTKIGALYEALSLLNSLPKENPDVQLYKAFALVAQWQYKETIPLLERYLHHAPSEFQALIAKLNLVAALAHEKDLKAQTLAQETLAQSRSYPRIHGMALELAAQDAINRKDFKEAREFLNQAKKTLLPGDKVMDLTLQRWAVIVDLLEKGRNPRGLQLLQKAILETAEIRDWRGVRHAHFYEAKIMQDSKLLSRLYFGSPYESFRETILSENPGWHPGTEYIWNLSSDPNPKIFDLDDATWNGETFKLKVGQLQHQLLSLLASDFYQPFRSAEIFGALYPGEFYSPDNSPKRIHRILERTRELLSQSKIPILIEARDSAYRLVSDSSCAIRVRVGGTRSRNVLLLEQFKEKRGTNLFQASEMAQILQVSKATVSRLLRDLEQKNLVKPTGAGKKIRYKMTG